MFNYNSDVLDFEKSHTLSLVREAFNRISDNYDREKDESYLVVDAFCNMPKSLPWRIIYRLNYHLFKHMGFTINNSKWFNESMTRYMQLLPMNYLKSLSSGIMLYTINKFPLLDEIYDMLSDVKSKETFDWFIKYKIALNITDIRNAEVLFPYPTRGTAYFNILADKMISKVGDNYQVKQYQLHTDYELVYHTWIYRQYLLSGVCEPKEGDVVIDAGAFLGETAVWFADSVGENGKVYSFEPSTQNMKGLEKNIKVNGLEHIITTIPKGLLDENKKIKFLTQSYSSSCSEQEGNVEIEVTTLDSFVNDNGLSKVDIIKMDIEGAELKALKGAVEAIKKFKPTLAICAYHKPEDIFEIPLFIKSLVPEYKIYLSHKCITWSETIIFASVKVE